MIWANSVLPIFTSDSSEKLRIAPDQVQIDTTHLRPQATAKSTLSRTHSPSTGQQWKTIIRQELDAPISVQENGRRRIMRRSEALIKGLVADALKGKDRPRKQVLDLADQ